MGAPDSFAVEVLTGDGLGWTGDLCDLGALSFSIENSGPSLLGLHSGGSSFDATVNLVSESSTTALDMGPWLDSTGSLHVAPGDYLHITATTEDDIGDPRPQQLFHGRIIAVTAVQDTPEKSPGPGWVRSWTITATNLGVDLDEIYHDGGAGITATQTLAGRLLSLRDGAGGTIWAATGVSQYNEDGGAPRTGSVAGVVSLSDLGTIRAEIDRACTSCWFWWTFAKNPWRTIGLGYSTAAIVKSVWLFVPRESVWRPATQGHAYRARERLIGDPWITDFPEGTYGPMRWNRLLTGLRIQADNSNYLAEVTVTPYTVTNETNTLNNATTYGARAATFAGHMGISAGHADNETHGTPPTGGGGAGYQIAKAWQQTAWSPRHVWSEMTWQLDSDDQEFCGDLLDLDRLDPLHLVWNDAVIPVRIQGVRITAAPGDWRVTVTAERVDPFTTWAVPITPP